jgi:DNA-binding Xre family transcriptional regulator
VPRRRTSCRFVRGRAERGGLTERERRRFGKRLDQVRADRNMTVGDLSVRTGIDVVTIVALIHGAEETGSLELMRLAAALEALPRDLVPECLAGPEDEEGQEGPGGDA